MKSAPRYTAPPGAQTITLPWHDDLYDALTEMLEVRGAVAVDGPTGAGKTFGTGLVCARTGVQTVVTRLGPRPGTSKVVRSIYADVTGRTPPRLATEAERQLEQVLAEKPRIVVIDEGQKLGRDGVDQLIHLHEHPDAQFTLVLVGMNLARMLAQHEEISGRFPRAVTFDRLRDDPLLDWLAAYHPMLARTDRELLRRLDNRHFRGNLRRWAQFAHAAYNRLDDPDSGGIDDQLAEASVHAVLLRSS